MHSFFFYEPYLELTDCEQSICLVCQLILSIYFWNIVTRFIRVWYATVFTIKWLTACKEVIATILSTETRPVVLTAIYIFASSLWREVAGASQVKQEGATVCLALPWLRWLPALTGVATNAIPLLDLKQGDCSSLRVTPWVEIFILPTMKVSTVEKSWGNRLVAEQLNEESAHFIGYLATSIWQEGFDHGGQNVMGRSYLLGRNATNANDNCWIITEFWWSTFKELRIW